MKTAPLNFAISCIVLFCATIADPLAAQNSAVPGSFPATANWKVSDETTFSGTIAGVVDPKPAGAPFGLNLATSGGRTGLIVNLGPNLRSEVRQSLTSGQPIQVTGLVRTIGGQNYLLARELVLGSQTIEIRNAKGLLLHNSPGSSPSSGSSGKGHTGGMGGAK